MANTRPVHVVTLDKLTYAGNLDDLESVAKDSRHVFIQGGIGDRTGRRTQTTTFETGIRKTVRWYLDAKWVERFVRGSYRLATTTVPIANRIFL